MDPITANLKLREQMNRAIISNAQLRHYNPELKFERFTAKRHRGHIHREALPGLSSLAFLDDKISKLTKWPSTKKKVPHNCY